MKKIIYLVMFPLLVGCGNVSQKPSGYAVVEDSIQPVVDSVVDVIDGVYEEDYYSDTTDDSYSEVGITFNPVSSTISDSEGTFSSSNFDCPSMIVYDKTNSVLLSWGGENIPLYKGNSPDTYVASQTKSGVTMSFVAYRSSSTGRIYLVICTTKGNGQSVVINFKP
jgi:hypothetical protein